MDAGDPQVRVELERRLSAIEHDEAGDVAHGALPAGDLWALAAIVVVALLVGALVAL
ncbi:hypothetical protein [Vallicoccus soli]|uniref:hypothetical protein n=1 Tax=Vallicoccus soli TaxID=2339232 RepID=UPI00140400B4|nr:hypothetical protein [Vallicoccus soli]